ncbi:MAG TPA: T9SS type A sorting domain-containing protein, partial [Bacteroidia bacterium]|nr:T9SS type A sorting domain-containing protein [Bacteroidia bacterium]
GGNSITIQVNPLPVITASSTRTLICRDFEFTTLNGGGGVSYNWLFIGAGNSVTVSPTAQTVYTVEGTDANGCVNTATILIRVSLCLGLNQQEQAESGIRVFPNPNNGEFNISSKKALDLEVLNALGQVVAEISLNESNNYQARLKLNAEGVYILSNRNQANRLNQKIIVQQ